MALQAYSLARDGEAYLSPHFRVQEFRCKDGSDPVFVDTALVELLEQLRAYFGKAVTITSGYHPGAQRQSGRDEVQPASVRTGGRYPGAGRKRRGGSRLCRAPAARLWRRGEIPGKGGQSRRLGARGHPGRKSPVEGVSAMESIISAILAGAVTLIGVLIANGKSQAVTDTKLEELTREVREHNNFARRVPILEEQMKVANHRIADLEKERN